MTENNMQKRHLIIAPHHDDEVIGCGGTVAGALRRGDQARVIIITNGDLSDPTISIEQRVANREQECLSACQVLGTDDVRFLKEPDRSLVYSRDMVERLIQEIIEYKPQYIYFPHADEADRDHRVVFEVSREAIMLSQSKFYSHDEQRFIKQLLQYEVWTPMKSFQAYSNITNTINIKKEALSQYESQKARLRLIEGFSGLSAYRGMQVGVPYAEVFKIEHM